MAEQDRAAGAGTRSRPRKPTPAERREQRSQVEDAAVVLEAGARFLEARPRSIEEVRRKLTRLGYQAELVTAAVDRLREIGYLDDNAFARAWVESRDRANPRGEHALRRELQLKGVDRALIDVVLEDRRQVAAVAGASRAEVTVSPDDAAAERLLRRKLAGIMREPDPRRRLQRSYAILARNGFPPETCGEVARRILHEAASDRVDGPTSDG